MSEYEYNKVEVINCLITSGDFQELKALKNKGELKEYKKIKSFAYASHEVGFTPYIEYSPVLPDFFKLAIQSQKIDIIEFLLTYLSNDITQEAKRNCFEWGMDTGNIDLLKLVVKKLSIPIHYTKYLDRIISDHPAEMVQYVLELIKEAGQIAHYHYYSNIRQSFIINNKVKCIKSYDEELNIQKIMGLS